MRTGTASRGVIVVAACLVAVAGCASNTSGGSSPGASVVHVVGGTARAGGTLTVAIGADPGSLDPALAQSEVSGDVLAPMCQGLYQRDANAQPQPELATAMPALSDGGRTVTIPLRSGVVFNDGTPFNAAAVKRSLEQSAQLPGSNFQPVMANVTSIDTPNPTTLVLHLAQPYAPLASQLTYLMIVSPAQRQKLNAKLGTDPVCVGPFDFVSRVVGTSITMKKSDLYYDRAKVHLDAIDFKIISDVNALEAAVRTGAADIADGIPLTDVATLQGTPGLRVISQVGGGWIGLAVNEANTNGLGKPPVQRNTPLAKSAQLRQALALSIDRTALAKISSNGLSYPGCSPIPPNSPYSDHPNCPGVDLTKARQLVKDSGYPTPIKVNMITYTSVTNSRLAEALQSMVAQVGFQLTITTFDLSTWISREYGGDYDTSLAVWLGTGDPSLDVGDFFRTEGAENFTGYHNSAVDALLAKAQEVTGPAARTPLYAQALRMIRADGATTFLLNSGVAMVARSNVVDFSFNPLANIDIAYAGFSS